MQLSKTTIISKIKHLHTSALLNINNSKKCKIITKNDLNKSKKDKMSNVLEKDTKK